MRWNSALLLAALTLLALHQSGLAAQSICYGTVSHGRLENGAALPGRGVNFSSYSAAAVALGRNHVHSAVQEVVLAAYGALHASAPSKRFVYGDTGWASGGRIRPHRTHQNGLSVDFMVPVIDQSGKSVALPGNVANRWGYDIEFDSSGRFGEYSIDFEALAEHIYQLHEQATRRGIGIRLVILDPPYLERLFSTARGPYLKERLPFMRGKAWWRHDEHYHIDFSVPCKAMSAGTRQTG